MSLHSNDGNIETVVDPLTNCVNYKRMKVTNTHKRVSSRSEESGFLVLDENEILCDRYRIVQFLGKGTYSIVYHCLDQICNKNVAIKVIRNLEKYREAALIELDVLEQIKKHDTNDEQHCLRLVDHFEFKDHICMVFDLYDGSLYDFIKANQYNGMALSHIKLIAKQLLKSVKCLIFQIVFSHVSSSFVALDSH